MPFTMRWLKRLFGVAAVAPAPTPAPKVLECPDGEFRLDDVVLTADEAPPKTATAADEPLPDTGARPAPVAAPEPPPAVPEPKTAVPRNAGAKPVSRKPRAPRRHK